MRICGVFAIKLRQVEKLSPRTPLARKRIRLTATIRRILIHYRMLREDKATRVGRWKVCEGTVY